MRQIVTSSNRSKYEDYTWLQKVCYQVHKYSHQTKYFFQALSVDVTVH